MDTAFEHFLAPEEMFLDPNNNSNNQDVIMKSKGKKNSLRLQSMINRCKLLSLSDSDEEHKNKEEKKSPSTSKASSSPQTKSRGPVPAHGHHSRARNNRSPYSHKLLSGKRNRNCWSDIDNSRAHSSASISIERQECSNLPSTSKAEFPNNPNNLITKRYPQRMDCQAQQASTSRVDADDPKVKKADVSQDFYGDDEASDFFDSSLSSHGSRVRRVKVRHFRAPVACPKYDLNTQSFSKRRKIK